MTDSTSTATGAAADTRIVRAAIHPAIGISRVGNSREAFYIGPQVVHPAAQEPGFYRDAAGALKREAAEFRVYGYNAAGAVVRELTAGSDEIAWEVHVANRKADWYQWQIAMDIPEAATTVLPRRNPKNTTERDTLAIDAGAQRIAGRNAPPVACTGRFTGVPVQLGELRTDAQGRLLFLPGYGISASPTDSPIYIDGDDNSFINADGWYDDTCDGPVSATVRVDGQAVPVEPAWVVSAPPNYAPQVKAERTLYDLLQDLYVQAGWVAAPAEASFTNDVYPILQRLSGLQWVNQGFATQFGHNGAFDFENAAFVERLSALPAPGAYDPNKELRRQVFNSFRPPQPQDGNQLPWPWLYGDAMTLPAGQSPRQNASISQTQSDILARWAAGLFTADWGRTPAPPDCIDAVPLQDQPATLDRAALEFCLADAFHPGCELTWPMRHLSLYSAPFRIRRRPAGVAEPDYGPTLDQATALSGHGPLNAQGPGDLNRWMGLPWQADTAWCRAGYDTHYDPFAPAFWPARVPNQVLTEQDYAIVVDPHQPIERRIAAFTNRTDWNKPLRGSTAEVMTTMVRIFGSMGLLEVRPGVQGDARFPERMMVAAYGPDVPPVDARSAVDGTSPMLQGKAQLLGQEAAAPGQDTAPALPPGANFRSHEEARRAPLPVRKGPPRT
ncbi:LodA/GoxA family CTQ-dependent oxidase [Acidovorax sp. NCPPB 4044]|uniref:LodA/GoxA family CTQ-dependent oxidase n=1 Tax=Acidovorax sp. NCPPB 4044 TaxID=2940490 RepID=UPI002303F511|nr:LodA/GoxA family CTQ-dependent oxidase [Acidovorax sp. NCPPB 4044]MDA8521193.1 LodA/GoxA family CTQ-dependent oxidase [Acidovorax sp. NCPPB 4044]